MGVLSLVWQWRRTPTAMFRGTAGLKIQGSIHVESWQATGTDTIAVSHCAPPSLLLLTAFPGDEEVATFSPETEEQLQQRLVQLLDLPLAPQATHWGTEEGKATHWGTEVEGERGFLSLNVAELAESLSDLPVHVRLDLSPQLLEQYGVNETDLEVGGALVEQTPPPRDLVPGGQDVKSLLSRAKDIAKQSFDFRTPEKTIVGRQQPSSLGTQQTCADLQSDAGLDSLLLSSSRQRPHPLPPGLDSLPPCFSTDSLSPPAGVKSHPRDDCSPPSPIISSSSSPARLPPSLVPAVEPSLMPTKDELDDILDDLLS